ncbi:aminopeptidase P1 [Dioscorea cayenensis subsp. rotundata]|uniref:Xaa-Pro aminopeptidase n=1 Tax=Dioscorea cayennensis subsp. rotundata TaxID=55577 RepID=A0AB40AGG2_DIOCR|nr:aminopeptidase P1 [Dioscorea cayenensis subsp. rotundata]
MADTLAAIRSLMASHSPPLDALIVPSEDSHQSEYVSERDKRRHFVSGFTGSAGLALITTSGAFLWTDGRYFLQATQQLSDQWKLMKIGEDPTVENWIADNLPKDAAVGVDPWCVSVETAQRWEQAFSKKNQRLIQLSVNLVDEVWKDRPPAQYSPVIVQPLEFAGQAVSDKLVNVREKLTREKAYGIIITALDEVAWLYNIRGNDVDYNPVVHAFAIVTIESAFFYVDKRKVSSEVHNHMVQNGIEIKEYNLVEFDVSLLGSGQLSCSGVGEEVKHLVTWIDPNSCCLKLYSKLSSDQVLMQQSPLALPKALKNPIELDGLRKAHVRDGVAVVQYLVWLDNQMKEICGASGYFLEPKKTCESNKLGYIKLTEVTVSDKLESFRAKQEHFKGLSFPTISSVGPNAAVIHYSPKAETCRELDAESIYLFDSGAQYQDGTTDITRTVHFGTPSNHEKACYTAVLQGHIALDTAVFPNGTTGHALDVLARVPLWKDGLDYRHGTGHGVGSYLNVHEGPHLISFRPYARNVPLQASMTVTNEPGYYEDECFGIRLENVLIVKDANTKFNFGQKGYLSFENITWVPYQKKLMDLTLLNAKEIKWIDSYHSACRQILAPRLNEQERAWLNKATEPIGATA